MELPVIDLAPYLSKSTESADDDELDFQLKRLCFEVSQTLRDTGALLVRDPRCSISDGDNDNFIDMMENYFQMPKSFKRLQERPLLRYQVGVTPEGTETPRVLVDLDMQEKLREIPKESQPLIPTGPDLKWRYMWRIGPRATDTRFQQLNSEPITPDGFPEWKDTMDSWGHKMISAVEGPHLLSPTGSNLEEYGKEGTVFAGYHYDINFLTIHVKSRFPGLNIWLKNGKKVEVKVPNGCLLVQSGKQMEYLTGGGCMAGMHEVVVTKNTVEAIKIAKQQNRSLWRVSSTLFAHVASDAVLKPLGHFSETPSANKYPPIFAGDFIRSEISVTKKVKTET